MGTLLLFELFDVDHNRWIVIQTLEFGDRMRSHLTELDLVLELSAGGGVAHLPEDVLGVLVA